MIQIIDKHKCCGCEACIQACPKNCISLVQDSEGFLYPNVNCTTCVDCGLCEKVCPIINKREQAKPLEVWAAQNTDEEIRKLSSSGGIATNLAEKIIEAGGVVFGVIMNDKHEAVHTFADTKQQLTAFMGSKYVQSRIGDSFKQVLHFLKSGKKVLFIGTPCQISGLKQFLRKDYENLYTVDFICHGVPSPGVFKWYLQEEINKFAAARKGRKNSVSIHPIHSIPKGDIHLPEGLKVMDIRFRDKREGWKKFSFDLRLAEASADGKQNTVSISANVTKNIFLKGFCLDLYLRPSCHQCHFRNYRSGSDITIADFWGQDSMFPEFDHDTGVSSVIIKTLKGKQLFKELDNLKKEEKTIEDVVRYNPSLIISKKESYRRHKFWRLVGKYSFEDSVMKTIHLSLPERVLSKFYELIGR